MQAWFADTYYFLALRNPKDEGHAKAVAASPACGGGAVFHINDTSSGFSP